jgi:hypothetical protein
MLERMGFELELHNNHFVHDEDDDKWIPVVASRKWVILSGDKRLTSQPVNKEAIITSRARVLLVTDSNSLPEQWAASVIVGRVRIQELLEKHPGPMCIKIGKHAKEHVNVAKEHVFKEARDATKETTEETVPQPADVRGSSDGHPEGQAGAEGPEEKAEGKEAGKD